MASCVVDLSLDEAGIIGAAMLYAQSSLYGDSQGIAISQPKIEAAAQSGEYRALLIKLRQGIAVATTEGC